MSLNIRKIEASDWKAFRAARLEALQDSPYAFGAIFAEESKQPESFWRDIVSRWSQDENTCFLLCENDQHQTVGMAGCYRSKQKADRSIVYSVWLHESIRGGETASTILTKLEHWSKRKGMTKMEGYVTENNGRARAFYCKLGFVETTEKIPLSWDESVEEILIVKELS